MVKPKATPKDWMALVTLMFPVLLISIDGTVVNFALPMISLDFGSSGTLLLWIIDIYSLVLSGLLVTMGTFADRFGRRKMLLIGGTGFVAISVLAAFSPNGYYLMAARAALGFFGAMLMPSTLSLIRNIFVNREQRRLALAIWAAGFSAGGALGPVIGGLLLQYFHWNSVFLIAVPFLVPMLIMTPIFVPKSKDPNPGPISILNVILSMAALTPLVLAIKSFSVDGVGWVPVVSLLVSVMAGTWFGYRQLHSENPMLDLRLFTYAPFTGSVLANLLSVFAFAGFLYYVSQHLQLVIGLSPLEASLTVLPGTIVMIVAGLSVVILAKRFPVNRIVSVSLLLSAAAYVLLGVTGLGATPAAIGAIFCLLALGTGPAETLTNDTIVSSVPAAKAGAASAISETAYEVGSVLGTAVLGSILVASYRNNVVVPGGLSAPDRNLAQETLGGAVNVAERLSGAQADALLKSAHAAFDSGVVPVAIIGAVVMSLAGILAWWMLAKPGFRSGKLPLD